MGWPACARASSSAIERRSFRSGASFRRSASTHAPPRRSPPASRTQDYFQWYLAQVRTSKTLLYEALGKAGIRFWPSDANFVLARFGDRASEVVNGLAARGVHVRDKSRDPACPGCIRITTGVVEHTQACIRALEEVLCGAA